MYLIFATKVAILILIQFTITKDPKTVTKSYHKNLQYTFTQYNTFYNIINQESQRKNKIKFISNLSTNPIGIIWVFSYQKYYSQTMPCLTCLPVVLLFLLQTVNSTYCDTINPISQTVQCNSQKPCIADVKGYIDYLGCRSYPKYSEIITKSNIQQLDYQRIITKNCWGSIYVNSEYQVGIDGPFLQQKQYIFTLTGLEGSSVICSKNATITIIPKPPSPTPDPHPNPNPNPNPRPDPHPQPQSSKLNVGAYVGIAIGSVVVVGALFVIIRRYLKNRRNGDYNQMVT